MLASKLSIWALGLALVFFIMGCADNARTKISTPPLAQSPSPQTIFGEVTLSPSAAQNDIASWPKLPNRPLSLGECIEWAQKVSPSLDSAEQNYMGAMWDRWKSITEFLPTASTSYRATRYDAASLEGRGRGPDPFTGRTQYAWQNELRQSVFTGGRNASGYLLAQLGVDAADIQKIQAKEDLMLAVKQSYYSILATQKALDVARQTVVNLESHLKVAQNFYDVGMVPKNQVLEAEVELAKAVQNQTDLSRDLTVNKSRLNILLRQPIENNIAVIDTLRYTPFPL
ncbi:MAG: TolC family protein, partial [Candidatus Adiutrix sp.]